MGRCHTSGSSGALQDSPHAVAAPLKGRLLLKMLTTQACMAQGYAFCEFQDISLTDYAIQNLNGKQIGNKFLTVKRALQPGPVSF